MKKTDLVLALSIVSVSCLQSKAWSNSSLLMQLAPILAASKGGSSVPAIPTVVSATGRIWMDRNLGASRVATSMDDEQAYGDLYQWGRRTDGHEKITSGTTTTLSSTDKPSHSKFILAPSAPNDWRSPQNNNLWQGAGGVNNPCPAGFRVPTSDEWQAEILSWNTRDPIGAFNSPLKLTLAGYHNYSAGTIDLQGSYGYYWSSTVDTTFDTTFAKNLLLGDGVFGDPAYINSYRRSAGYSVRCIKDDSAAQVPTVVSATGRRWMDRNLGASRVATSMDDGQAYGDLYQWGRRTDGHEKITSGTTTTLSSTDNPSHSKFILASSAPNDWRSPQNNNLWQGASGVNNPCPAGFRVPTANEWQEEIDSWSSQDDTGAFASPLQLPLAGFRDSNVGALNGRESISFYWSSTIDGSAAKMLQFDSGSAFVGGFFRANGQSIRCIKD